ncbi:MAG: hypothetical protein RLZZ577_1081 [Bacteroidota bacterium]|jgi:hypothetical protein
MKKYIEEINQVLSEWDPNGVGEEIARDEYRGYISNIIKSSGSKDGIMKCLEKIVDELEVGFDVNDEKQNQDLQIVCNRIYEVLQFRGSE